ncbi:hypothetical protein BGZ57DRAFT_970192 [Hyaloscypha finlandica]|nr:hypothetical protein BGZ57DRAFT_970192 [Hyaloscypha finlandica]
MNSLPPQALRDPRRNASPRSVPARNSVRKCVSGAAYGFLLLFIIILNRKVFFHAYIAFPLVLREIHNIDGREGLENLHRLRKLQNLFFAETDLGLLDAAMQLHEKTQGSKFIIFEGRPTHDCLCHLFKCFKAAQIGLGNPTVEWLIGASWDCDRELVWIGEHECISDLVANVAAFERKGIV